MPYWLLLFVIYKNTLPSVIDDDVLFQYAHDTRNKFCVVCRSLYSPLGDAAIRESCVLSIVFLME